MFGSGTGYVGVTIVPIKNSIGRRMESGTGYLYNTSLQGDENDEWDMWNVHLV